MEDSQFFLRPPFRSTPFLIGTFVVACCVFCIGAILVKHLRWLPFNSAVGLVLAGFFLVAAWRSALRTHESISMLLHARQQNRQNADPETETLINAMLSRSSDITQRGLLLTAVTAGTLLIAFMFAALH
jgi:hypothetical protein